MRYERRKTKNPLTGAWRSEWLIDGEWLTQDDVDARYSERGRTSNYVRLVNDDMSLDDPLKHTRSPRSVGELDKSPAVKSSEFEPDAIRPVSVAGWGYRYAQ